MMTCMHCLHLTLECNPWRLARRRGCASEGWLLPLPGAQIQDMQVVQPGASPVAPKYDHLAFHENRSSPEPGGGGHAISGGAVPCPCCHIQEVNIVQTLPVCSPPTKYYQPEQNMCTRLVSLHPCATACHPCLLPQDSIQAWFMDGSSKVQTSS